MGGSRFAEKGKLFQICRVYKCMGDSNDSVRRCYMNLKIFWELQRKLLFYYIQKKAHICRRELNIYTYPLYVQDSAVKSCSHASMIFK